MISNEGWEHTFSDIIGIHDYTQHGSQLTDRFGSAEAIAAKRWTVVEVQPQARAPR